MSKTRYSVLARKVLPELPLPTMSSEQAAGLSPEAMSIVQAFAGAARAAAERALAAEQALASSQAACAALEAQLAAAMADAAGAQAAKAAAEASRVAAEQAAARDRELATLSDQRMRDALARIHDESVAGAQAMAQAARLQGELDSSNRALAQAHETIRTSPAPAPVAPPPVPSKSEVVRVVVQERDLNGRAKVADVTIRNS